LYAKVAATRFDPERLFKGPFNEFMEKVAECNECGECEPKCPYNLPIREKIGEAADLFFAEKKKYVNKHP
jgi:predicted aldo/keto reductase-like oxidoreductase